MFTNKRNVSGITLIILVLSVIVILSSACSNRPESIPIETKDDCRDGNNLVISCLRNDPSIAYNEDGIMANNLIEWPNCLYGVVNKHMLTESGEKVYVFSTGTGMQDRKEVCPKWAQKGFFPRFMVLNAPIIILNP